LSALRKLWHIVGGRERRRCILLETERKVKQETLRIINDDDDRRRKPFADEFLETYNYRWDDLPHRETDLEKMDIEGWIAMMSRIADFIAKKVAYHKDYVAYGFFAFIPHNGLTYETNCLEVRAVRLKIDDVTLETIIYKEVFDTREQYWETEDDFDEYLIHAVEKATKTLNKLDTLIRGSLMPLFMVRWRDVADKS